MEFQVGDKVVYPSQGVSVVESITTQEFLGEEVRCYNLRLLSTNSRVMVPVSNSERVGLRPLAPPDHVEKVLDRLRDQSASGEGDWKDRYKANLDRIKTGDLEAVVDVILCLADVASRKSLSFRERKMFDHARQLLVYEVAEVEDRPVEEVEADIDRAIQLRLGEDGGAEEEG